MSDTIKILHVEDDEMFVELVGIMLSDKMYDVEVARNGSEAVDMAFKGIYDVILMDILMPIMDGRTATKTIKKTIKDTPIIACTAYDVDIKGEDSFFDDYLRKPFTKKVLNEKIMERYLKSKKDDE